MKIKFDKVLGALLLFLSDSAEIKLKISKEFQKIAKK